MMKARSSECQGDGGRVVKGDGGRVVRVMGAGSLG